jgi:hypothetical protein
MAGEVTIETFRPAVGEAPRSAFSLLFHGPAEPALAQGTIASSIRTSG